PHVQRRGENQRSAGEFPIESQPADQSQRRPAQGRLCQRLDQSGFVRNGRCQEGGHLSLRLRLPLPLRDARRHRHQAGSNARSASDASRSMKPRSPARYAPLLALCALVACTNGGGLGSIGGNGGGPTATPSPLPPTAIGVAIPTGKIGVENDPTWGIIGGYTQSQTSQVLAFPPGSKITIKNLSSTDLHTLNVIEQTSGPPPHWPVSPSLSFYPSGHGILGTTYASGTLNPGDSVTVKLTKPGIYLIGCAYHYVYPGMRGIIQVSASATPGPTASPGPGGYAEPRKAPPPAAHAKSDDASQPHLVDQTGRRFTLGSLTGKPLAITFVSAHCDDACPLINAQFSAAARSIAKAHLTAKLVTITLDPDHDSPATMRKLANRFEADPRYWLVASGKPSDVRSIMHSFGVIPV